MSSCYQLVYVMLRLGWGGVGWGNNVLLRWRHVQLLPTCLRHGGSPAMSAWSTFIEVGGSPATSGTNGRRLVLCGRPGSTRSTYLHRGRRKSGDEWCVWAFRGKRSTRSTSGSFCVAGAALGAPQARFAWHAQHLERLRLVLCGTHSTRSTSGSFCVAGAALEASQLRMAWHLFKAQTIHTTPSTLHHQTHHHQDNTIYTTSSTQSHQHNLINTTPSTQHHLHNTIYTTSPTHSHQHNLINTTPSTQHHLHNTIYTHHQHNTIYTTSSIHHHLHSTVYTTPSTQHHLRNTIYTASSNTGRCSTWSTAILALLRHTCWYPFCYSSLGIVLCSVSLTYSTVGCPKTLLTCGVIWSYNFSTHVALNSQLMPSPTCKCV